MNASAKSKLRRGRRNRAGGFTLIELIAVVAILGIVALAAGSPVLSSMGSMRARAASARLTTDIRLMQRTAMASGLRTWVTFSTGSNNYRLYIENPANPGKAGRQAFTHPFSQDSGAVQFGAGPFAGVSITSVNVNATSEIEFDSLGVPYDGSGGALASTGQVSLSSGVAITIQPVSGLVERAG